MSWFIIEGPDDTGKTTLARQLEARGWHYEHASGQDTLPILARRMSEVQDFAHVVWDRAHLGEMVHGPLDRGYEPSPGWFRLIEAFLIEKDAHCILLSNRHNLTKAENNEERHLGLRSWFKNVAASSSLHWSTGLTYNGNLVEGEQSVGFEERPDAEGLGGLHNGRTEVWVLGDRQSSKTPVPWPFATRCGTELIWPAINPVEVRVSNSHAWAALRPVDDLHERWEQIGRPMVIALGEHSRLNCMLADVPVEVNLPHPQWHLRFQASKPDVYRYHLNVAILNCLRKRLAL